MTLYELYIRCKQIDIVALYINATTSIKPTCGFSMTIDKT